MSAADDALREMAANRGCRLVRSRVRTPGKGNYGKFGLKDAKTGKAVLGVGKTGLTATAEEVETYLRGGAASAWKSSVGTAPVKKKVEARPVPAPEPKAEPKLAIRDVRPKDIDALVALIVALGYEVTAADLRQCLAVLRREAQEPGIRRQVERTFLQPVKALVHDYLNSLQARVAPIARTVVAPTPIATFRRSRRADAAASRM